MRLLVIEDEKKTREYLAKGLRESGFVVDAVEDGETGLHLACSEDYDLIILDVMLPGREIEGPMAIVILGGLITSTLLNLLVLPTLALRYGWFETMASRERFGLA